MAVSAGGDQPFAFLNHGLWSYVDEIRSTGWYLVFASEVAADARAGILEGAPAPAAGGALWSQDGRILLLESPPERYFDSQVWLSYGPAAGESEDGVADESSDDEFDEEDFQLTEREAQAFSDALDSWLIGMHARRPLALVIAWHGSREDAWSRWSGGQVTARVVPLLKAIVADARPPSEQTREENPSEQLLARTVRAAIAAYFDTHDPRALEQSLRDELAALLTSAMGHGDQYDESLGRLLRYL